jgi:hypothetical protein
MELKTMATNPEKRTYTLTDAELCLAEYRIFAIL